MLLMRTFTSQRWVWSDQKEDLIFEVGGWGETRIRGWKGTSDCTTGRFSDGAKKAVYPLFEF